MRHADDLGLDEYRAAIAVTRLVLGPKMRVQAPPNLVDLRRECRALLDAGVDDWGGVSPLTPDHVNPERPWPSLERLRAVTAECGFELRAAAHRAPRVRRRRRAVARPAGLRPRRRAGATDDGLAARPAYDPTGLPWQEPDGGFATVRGGRRPHRPARRRSTPPAAPTTAAATSTTSTATGTPLREQIVRHETAPEPVPRSGADRDGLSALAAAERDPAGLTDEQALTLMTAEGELLEQVCRLADDLRRDTVGDEVTYVVNRNINFTNVCYVGCRFCAFAQRRTDADAYSLSLDQVADRAEEAWELGATEVCMQGGIDPELPGTAYFDLAAAVKQRVPGMHVHAFSPDGDRQRRLPHRAVGRGLPDQGPRVRPRHHPRHRRGDPRRRGPLGAHQGQAAHADLDRRGHHRAPGRPAVELDDDVRPRRQPPALGRSTCGCSAGSRTRPAGFTEFVPLPFVHHSSPIYLAGVARPGPDPARQPRRARAGPDPAARPDRQHPDQLGQARHRRHPGDAPRRRQRPRRHPDGGDHLPDGRLRARLGARPSPSSPRSPPASAARSASAPRRTACRRPAR